MLQSWQLRCVPRERMSNRVLDHCICSQVYRGGGFIQQQSAPKREGHERWYWERRSNAEGQAARLGQKTEAARPLHSHFAVHQQRAAQTEELPLPLAQILAILRHLSAQPAKLLHNLRRGEWHPVWRFTRRGTTKTKNEEPANHFHLAALQSRPQLRIGAHRERVQVAANGPTE